MVAEQALREGNLEQALTELQLQIRTDPANVKPRIFLFQLQAVLGQWPKVLSQLEVLAQMDAATLAMVQTYREAVHCELLRAEVFNGQRVPLVFGEPTHWLALLLEALKFTAQGQPDRSQSLAEQALEEAPATAGRINDEAFSWIADADSRLGPVLEAIINGRYYWIPFHRIRTLQTEPPEDLRDIVWMPAHFTWTNGGEMVGLIPTRYAGSEQSADNGIRLARKTEWISYGEELYRGLGQRMLATDAGEYSLLEVRTIELEGNAEHDEGATERDG